MRLFLLLPLLCFFPHRSAAQTGTEIHRTQDSTRDPSGWFFAESTRGNFSVLLPVPFNDYSMGMQDTAGRPMHFYAVGATGIDGTKYTVSRMPLVTAAQQIDLESLPASMGGKGTTVSNVRRGKGTIAFQVQNAQNGAFIEYRLAQNSFFTLIVEYRRSQEQKAAREAARIFGSLRIER